MNALQTKVSFTEEAGEKGPQASTVHSSRRHRTTAVLSDGEGQGRREEQAKLASSRGRMSCSAEVGIRGGATDRKDMRPARFKVYRLVTRASVITTPSHMPSTIK